MVPVWVGGHAPGFGVVSVRVHVVVGPWGVCLPGAPGISGEASTRGEISARATPPRGHKDTLPGHPTPARALG